jgi:hypothetical protein
MNELVYLRAETGALRTAGSTLIVPVVALREAVIHAVNSDVPELVPYSTLVAAPQEWNRKPVCLGHPASNGSVLSASNNPTVLATHGFGTIQRARVENRKLLMDLHIDPKKAEQIGACRLLQRLRDGEQVDVSVGAFVRTEPTSGTFNGKPYRAVWTQLTPDHIAMLETSRGACSLADGCGTFQRAAEQYVPLDGYAPALALRAASEKTSETFAAQYKADRLREFEAEYEQMRAAQQVPPVMTGEELKRYEPPNPYASLETTR